MMVIRPRSGNSGGSDFIDNFPAPGIEQDSLLESANPNDSTTAQGSFLPAASMLGPTHRDLRYGQKALEAARLLDPQAPAPLVIRGPSASPTIQAQQRRFTCESQPKSSPAQVSTTDQHLIPPIAVLKATEPAPLFLPETDSHSDTSARKPGPFFLTCSDSDIPQSSFSCCSYQGSRFTSFWQPQPLIVKEWRLPSVHSFCWYTGSDPLV